MAKTSLVNFAIAVAATVGLLTGSAQAMNMLKHNARVACGALVTQAHPDLKGKERSAEIKKCKGDGDAYNKAAGF